MGTYSGLARHTLSPQEQTTRFLLAAAGVILILVFIVSVLVFVPARLVFWTTVGGALSNLPDGGLPAGEC